MIFINSAMHKPNLHYLHVICDDMLYNRRNWLTLWSDFWLNFLLLSILLEFVSRLPFEKLSSWYKSLYLFPIISCMMRPTWDKSCD